ncbi:SAM-dependent methyltransferase [Catenulispora sp. GP43]|uniref:class I SAM-dependent methyltransferase n=1 Tax=Catenulispora sp. GP43 TaxID=3156263 RepID=UPI0035197E79
MGRQPLFADLVHAASGPVADVGCGSGRITAFLRGIGVDAFGIDLSPAMVEVARRDFPGLRFEAGSMTGLDLADASMASLLVWYSLIHVPDHGVGPVLKQTQGYGGHPMNVYVHRRQPSQVTDWLTEAGFTVEAVRPLTAVTTGWPPDLGARLQLRSRSWPGQALTSTGRS